MKPNKQVSIRAMRTRLSLAEVLYNACIASANYRTVFLQSLGINAGRIGIINSVSTIANIIAPPVWGAISDKIRSPRICFAICLALNAVLMAALPFAANFGAPLYLGVIICLAASSLFSGPANNMMEQWLVRIDNSGIGISYGSIRLWASIGYAAMGMVYAFLLERIDVSNVYFFYLIFAIPAILLALSTPEPYSYTQGQKKEKIRFKDMPFKRILNYWIVIYIIYCAVNSIPGNWKNTYFIYVLNEYGFASSSFGIFMCISACCEVPALILSKKIMDKLGIMKTMFICIAANAIETTLYTFGTSIAFVFIGQIIKGFALGMGMACQVQLVYRLSRKGLETTTQALIGSIGSVIAIIVSAVGGYALEAAGLRPFFGIITIAEIAAGLVLMLGLVFGSRVLKKTLPEGIG